MEEIAKIFPSIFKGHAKRLDPQLFELLAPLWPRVAGKQIARHSRPVAFSQGTMTLAASCTTWATQLRQMAEEIRAEINRFFRRPVVRKLRVQVVPAVEWAERKPWKTEPAAATETQQIPQAHPGFEAWAQLDPEIARILERSFSKYFARNRNGVNGWH